MEVTNLVNNLCAAGLTAVNVVTITHPIDVVKTRLQISKEHRSLGAYNVIKNIYIKENITSFWKGISAAWLRELSYTTLRIGLYAPIKSAVGVNDKSSFIMKFLAGSLSGAIGSTAGNPFDVLKTKMIANESKSKNNIINVGTSLFKSNGLSGFYKGLQANVMRAMVLNGTTMACYDTFKLTIKNLNLIHNEFGIQSLAAFSSGFCVAITVTPFDVVRTRLMNQTIVEYKGFTDCVIKLMKYEGFFSLYSGFFPIWSRLAPVTLLQLVIFEQLKPIFNIKDL